MSGYSIVVSPCFACKKLFGYNPHHVPSLWIDPVTKLPPDLGGDPDRAQREPLCRDCVAYANEQRSAQGKQPFRIHPDAYEPIAGMP